MKRNLTIATFLAVFGAFCFSMGAMFSWNKSLHQSFEDGNRDAVAQTKILHEKAAEAARLAAHHSIPQPSDSAER